MSLLQTSTVQEYCCQFKMISTPLRGVSQFVLEAAFVNGLRSDIQAKFRQLESAGLVGKMRIAQKIEDKQMALRAYQVGLLPRWSKPTQVGPLVGQCAPQAIGVTTGPRASRPPPPVTTTFPLHPPASSHIPP